MEERGEEKTSQINKQMINMMENNNMDACFECTGIFLLSCF